MLWSSLSTQISRTLASDYSHLFSPISEFSHLLFRFPQSHTSQAFGFCEKTVVVGVGKSKREIVVSKMRLIRVDVSGEWIYALESIN